MGLANDIDSVSHFISYPGGWLWMTSEKAEIVSNLYHTGKAKLRANQRPRITIDALPNELLEMIIEHAVFGMEIQVCYKSE
jgi:hypothetical protein